MSHKLRGVLTAIATPFTTDQRSIDEKNLRAQVDRNIEAGVHGLVPGGSTGEFVALSHDERRRLLDVILDQTDGRVPVIPHTGATSTAEAIKLTKHAEEAGASGVMLVAPYYEPFSLPEITSYYKDVANSTSLSVMAYNLPPATGVNLTPDYLADLVEAVPNINAVKDTSGDYAAAAELIHTLGDKVSVFVGWDPLFCAALLEGAAGSVIGAANVIPRDLVAVYDAVQDGDLEKVRQLWNATYPVLKAIVGGQYNASIKTGMDLVGHSAGPQRAPGQPAEDGVRDKIQSALSDLGY